MENLNPPEVADGAIDVGGAPNVKPSPTEEVDCDGWTEPNTPPGGKIANDSDR